MRGVQAHVARVQAGRQAGVWCDLALLLDEALDLTSVLSHLHAPPLLGELGQLLVLGKLL